MYFPKSQIKTNLLTNGGEYSRVDNGLEYKGYYFQTSKGEYYTGRNPEDGSNILLVPIFNSKNSPLDTTINASYIAELGTDNPEIVASYVSLKNINIIQRKLIPQNVYPTPQPQDYINESFVRYFVKKRNEKKYLEINKETYDKLLSQDPTYLFELYKPLKLNWQISGDKAKAYQTNETQTALLARREKLDGFIEYFKGNFNQLYALYTQGNTYVIANNGKPYTGFYHIMPNGQIMTGKNHTNKGINLVLREDYVEQEQPLLNPGIALGTDSIQSIDSANISNNITLF